MGSTCSCYFGNHSDENQFLQDFPPEHSESILIQDKLSKILQQSELPTVDPTIPQPQVIALQSLIRGYIDRQQTKNINILSKSFSTPFHRQVQELPENQVPDYSNSLTLKIISNLGPLECEPVLSGNLVSKGPVMMENKAIYIGQWSSEGIREGMGTQYWKDGSVYEGNWERDKANGKGRMIHANGDVYEGEWENDRACGVGVYIHSYGNTGNPLGGVKYEGEWKNDKQHGYGTEIWPNGLRYSGSYQNGIKHGKGKIEWAEGSLYEGEFTKNSINGLGTYCWSDGRVFVGEWKNNKMHGKGVFTWPDGRIYEGEYQNDKKHGFGVLTWKDGRKYEGFWIKGRQHGKGVYTSSNGISKEGSWVNGKKIQTLIN